MATVADISGFSSDAVMALSAPSFAAALQSVDPSPAMSDAAASYSSYGDYYSPPELEDQKQTIPGQEGDGTGVSRTACVAHRRASLLSCPRLGVNRLSKRCHVNNPRQLNGRRRLGS